VPPLALIAGLVVLAAWAVVAVDNAVQALRGATRERDVARWAAGAALVVVVVACGIALERRSGPGAMPWLVTAIGVVVAVAGALLHLGARRAMGAAWSSRTGGATELVERGPYARVRHPIYVGLGLLAIGTMLAHPSHAIVTGGLALLAGLAMKIAREERALAAAFGPRWDDYCRRVPRFLPRLRRRGT
jgi:protein-S-isoprenylcysteine O-methyltransferase Ste14